ncbi:hypothetical protein D3C76_756100 [compost metagenome]
MNLVDCRVIEVLGKPYKRYGKWWRDVRYSSWGSDSKTELMFQTEAEAEAVQVGHEFLA